MAGFPGLGELFEGRHFDRAIIILCAMWYLRFKLGFRELVKMMAECGLSMALTTIMRWVHHYAPEIRASLERVRAAYRAFVARRRDLREDPVYLYRAVDREGMAVNYRLSTRRDVAAAKAFFRKAMKGQGSTPRTITLASHRTVREMKSDGQMPVSTKLRSSRREASHGCNNVLQAIQDRAGHNRRQSPAHGRTILAG